MLKQTVLASIFAAGLMGGAVSAEVAAAHDAFRNAFAERDWEALRSVLAEDVVFHRAAAPDVFVGQDAVIEHSRRRSRASGT